MSRVVVDDASCLVDLRKGRLFSELSHLAYRIVVPQSIRETEAISFSESDWKCLEDIGMETYDLSPDEVQQALSIKANYGALSAFDNFCLVVAQANEGVLLTGDRQLRRIATQHGLAVHGVLWVVEELQKSGQSEYAVLKRALQKWREDPLVFLPFDEIDARLEALTTNS